MPFYLIVCFGLMILINPLAQTYATSLPTEPLYSLAGHRAMCGWLSRLEQRMEVFSRQQA